MRVSRLFRTIIRLILLILTLSMSLISFLGGYSAILILSNIENVRVPDGDINANVTINEYGIADDSLVDIPYKIKNVGFFDLTDIELDIKIFLKYHDQRNPKNGTTTEKLMDITKKIDKIRSGDVGKDNFNLTKQDFNNVSFIEISTNIDYYAEPLIWYTATIKLSARYSLGLLYFSVEIEDYDVGEQDYL